MVILNKLEDCVLYMKSTKVINFRMTEDEIKHLVKKLAKFNSELAKKGLRPYTVSGFIRFCIMQVNIDSSKVKV